MTAHTASRVPDITPASRNQVIVTVEDRPLGNLTDVDPDIEVHNCRIGRQDVQPDLTDDPVDDSPLRHEKG
jgi:hypothetical protein